MTLEKQVCSMPQGKRLVELGIENIGYFSFLDAPSLSWSKSKKHIIFERNRGVPAASAIKAENDEVQRCIYPAFTVAELGAMLPDQIPTNSNIVFAELIIRNNGEWGVGYDVDRQTDGGYGATVKSLHCVQFSTTEAAARAAMLIYLLENNYITAENCNKALQA